MSERELWKDLVIEDRLEVYKEHQGYTIKMTDMTTRIKFMKHGKEVAYATLYQNGNLYCNIDWLGPAVEWCVNNVKHINWRYIRGVGLV